ncbi:MAG: hypothetical protein ABW184_03440 [Sphingobium sp.]
MTQPDPQISDLFFTSFSADLEALNSPARVALAQDGTGTDMIEMRDDDGAFLDHIPASSEPRMVAIAYRLYGHALNNGIRAGEEAAFAKLRFLIGAAAA